MKTLLLITFVSLLSLCAASQTFTCTCTYLNAYEWDLAGSYVNFKSQGGDTLNFVIENLEKDFWDESGSEENNGGIIKTRKQNVGRTYLIIYKHVDADGEGGATEYNQVITFKQLE